MPSLLHGQRALITGSSRGIGLAIAQRFAQEGCSIILIGRSPSTLSTALSTLPSSTKPHTTLVGDISTSSFWKSVRKQKPGMGKIDILVNAAGITHVSPLFATSEERIEGVLNTNLRGTVWACREVGRGMLREKDGVIVNVGSLLGVKGGVGSAVYAASKAGIIGFTRALAAEVGTLNIRVNAIVPGYIETDMTAAMTPEARSEALDAIPLKRFGEASEIADAAVFLATNKYANNCVLNLDGGLSAM